MSETEVDDVLAHFGVKGMHWGQHKAEIRLNPRYSTRQMATDRRNFGKGSVVRISRSMDAGKTHKQAVNTEHNAQLVKGLVIGGGLIVGGLLLQHGHLISTAIAGRAETNRGRSAMIGIAKNAAKVTFAKSRGGVFNITTLK